MISGDFTHCVSLRHFYEEISNLHRKAHGEYYTAHHTEMFVKLTMNCESYRELGVNQGATAANAALCGIDDMHLIDINLTPFRPYEPLFEDVKKLRLDECNDLEVPDLYPVDFLFIDSLHTYEHVSRQLSVHSLYAQKYIMIHDSASQPGVKTAVDEFLMYSDDWILDHHYPLNVGYSLIKRKGLVLNV